MSVGARIRAARESRGWSRAELAERLGVTRQAVGMWERGRRTPNADSAPDLEDVLGVAGLCEPPPIRVSLDVLAAVWEGILPLAKAQGIPRRAFVGRVLADLARSASEEKGNANAD